MQNRNFLTNSLLLESLGYSALDFYNVFPSFVLTALVHHSLKGSVNIWPNFICVCVCVTQKKEYYICFEWIEVSN